MEDSWAMPSMHASLTWFHLELILDRMTMFQAMQSDGRDT